MTHRNQEIRERVEESYTAAVRSAASRCCGGSAGTDDAVPKGVAAKLAGYSSEELAVLPADAVVNSFGCGNPVAFADIKEGETVLDLGSGAGIDLLLAARNVGASGHVIGVDMTDEMIARARRVIAESGYENVEVRKGLIELLPVEDHSIDLVISNCVINLSPEKERVFSEIARVLKPGGRVRISDIVVERLPRWVRSIPAVYDSCVGGAISEAAYIAGLRKAGLDDVEVSERLIYDSRQVADLVLSELPGRWKSVVRACRLTALVRWLARSVSGRVWSARFLARQPGTSSVESRIAS